MIFNGYPSFRSLPLERLPSASCNESFINFEFRSFQLIKVNGVLVLEPKHTITLQAHINARYESIAAITDKAASMVDTKLSVTAAQTRASTMLPPRRSARLSTHKSLSTGQGTEDAPGTDLSKRETRASRAGTASQVKTRSNAVATSTAQAPTQQPTAAARSARLEDIGSELGSLTF